MDNGLAKIHLSVDCTVLGFNGTRLEVLLIRRTGVEDGQAFHDKIGRASCRERVLLSV